MEANFRSSGGASARWLAGWVTGSYPHIHVHTQSCLALVEFHELRTRWLASSAHERETSGRRNPFGFTFALPARSGAYGLLERQVRRSKHSKLNLAREKDGF